MQVIVVREAFCDTPNKVILFEEQYDVLADKIFQHYPGAVIDKRGGFDTPDGGSWLFDTITVIN